jgi:hypothetical protein
MNQQGFGSLNDIDFIESHENKSDLTANYSGSNNHTLWSEKL